MFFVCFWGFILKVSCPLTPGANESRARVLGCRAKPLVSCSIYAFLLQYLRRDGVKCYLLVLALGRVGSEVGEDTAPCFLATDNRRELGNSLFPALNFVFLLLMHFTTICPPVPTLLVPHTQQHHSAELRRIPTCTNDRSRRMSPWPTMVVSSSTEVASARASTRAVSLPRR